MTELKPWRLKYKLDSLKYPVEIFVYDNIAPNGDLEYLIKTKGGTPEQAAECYDSVARTLSNNNPPLASFKMWNDDLWD